MWKNFLLNSKLQFLALAFCLLQISCGGGNGDDGSTPSPPANITGDAILEIQIDDGGR